MVNYLLERTKRRLCLAGIAMLLAGGPVAYAAEFPAESDWFDRGTIINHGANGQWDRYLFGMMTPCALVQKGGTYFLYYIGGDSEDGNGGDARNRKLGVATSTDLASWTKSASNPIREWSPEGDWEEGISSCAAVVDGTDIVLYYNALNFIGGNSVTSDIRVMTSTDGVNFGDDQELISHGSACAGCGDEIWPTAVIRSGATWYVYYSGNLWNLYMATLSSRDTVVDTELVLDSDDLIISGMAVSSDDIELAVFTPYQTFGAPWSTGVRTTTFADPGSLSGEVERYSIDGVGSHQSYYFDKLSNQWLMFYQTNPGDVSSTNIGLMTAPPGTQGVNVPQAITDLFVN